jgi:hypothetical protein
MFFWTAIAVIVVSSLYFDFQKTKLQQQKSSGNVEDLKRVINSLTADNQAIKDRLRYLEEIMVDDHKKIKLRYEKEQIEMDRLYKFDDDTSF